MTAVETPPPRPYVPKPSLTPELVFGKKAGGTALQWNLGQRRPMIDVYFPSYFEAELHIVGQFEDALEALISRQKADDSVGSPK
jgi:hypothetical protein